MQFEFDRDKSDANKLKHGLTLREAARIWEGSHVEVTARTIDEPRWMAIGMIQGKPYACIYTIRGETTRLISCRRARAKEVQLYHDYVTRAGHEG